MTKRWPVERFLQVAERLVESFDAKILLLGDAQDVELTEFIKQKLSDSTIDLAGKLDLMQSACALNRADFAMTNDSGLMHMATALKKPVIAIFGSTVQELGFFPVGEQNLVIQNNELSCRPCTHIGKNTCPRRHFKCMMDISAEEVWTAAARIAKKCLS